MRGLNAADHSSESLLLWQHTHFQLNRRVLLVLRAAVVTTTLLLVVFAPFAVTPAALRSDTRCCARLNRCRLCITAILGGLRTAILLELSATCWLALKFFVVTILPIEAITTTARPRISTAGTTVIGASTIAFKARTLNALEMVLR